MSNGRTDREKLIEDIRSAVNRNCAENGSDTPDYILAEYLVACIEAFDATAKARDKWHGNSTRWSKLAGGAETERR